MQKKNKISNEQIKALVVTTIIGVGILSLPSDVAMILNSGGWLAIVIGGIVLVPFFIMLDKLFKMYPEKSFFQIGREVMNPIILNLFLIIFLAYTIVLLSYTNRVFAEVIKAYLLETTPIEIIILTMLLAISYIARSQIEAVARMAVMIYPIIIGFIIFLILVNLPNTDFTNIYPLLDMDYKLIPWGVASVFFSYIGYEIIILAFNFSEDNSKSLKYSLRGLFIVIGVYLIVYFITLSQYGIHQLKREIWPTIAIVKEVDLPGYFVENLDGIVMAIWVMVVYGTMGPIFHSGGVILSNIFKTDIHEIFILPLIPIIYIIALLPENLVEVNEVLGRILDYFALAAIIVIPTIIFILAIIKKRREKA